MPVWVRQGSCDQGLPVTLGRCSQMGAHPKVMGHARQPRSVGTHW